MKYCKNCNKKSYHKNKENEEYLCRECKKSKTKRNRSRECRKCQNLIEYQSLSAMRNAILKNSICASCKSNQIPSILTDHQKEILDGLMLGDGSIVFPNKNRSKYPRLCLNRKTNDKEYLNWQYNIFKEFYSSEPKDRDIYDKRTNKVYKSTSLISKSGQLFLDYYNKWYPNKKKIVPRDLKLSPLLLLIWFLDDGFIQKPKNNLRLKLATDGFIEEDVKFLCSLLNEYFAKDIIQKFNYFKNGNGFQIHTFSTLLTIRFIKVIEPIFPNFMDRKRTWKDFDFKLIENGRYGKSTKEKKF